MRLHDEGCLLLDSDPLHEGKCPIDTEPGMLRVVTPEGRGLRPDENVPGPGRPMTQQPTSPRTAAGRALPVCRCACGCERPLPKEDYPDPPQKCDPCWYGEHQKAKRP